MNIEEMSDRLFAEALGKKLGEMRRNFEGVYVIDPENSKKFQRVLQGFAKLVQEAGGSIVRVDSDPLIGTASLIAEFQVLTVYKEEMAELLDILKDVDVFGVDAINTGAVHFDVTVQDVWRAIPKEK